MKPKKLKKRQRRQRRKDRKHTRLQANGQGSFTAVDEGASVNLLAAESGENGQKRIRRFEMTAYTGGRLFVAGFKHPAIVDLTTLKSERHNYPSHLDHKQQQRVGHTTKVSIGGGQIKAEGLISAANKHAKEVVDSGDNGFPWQSSIGVGLSAARVQFVRAGSRVAVNGRTFDGPVYVVRNGALKEISFVSVGGDEGGATARVAASALPQGEETMTFEQWLEAKGFDIAAYDESQLTLLKAAFETEKANDEEEMEAEETEEEELEAEEEEEGEKTVKAKHGGKTLKATLAKERKVRAAEIKRIKRIGDLCAEYDNPVMKINNQEVSLEAHAIEEGWDANKTELECVRRSRGSASVQAHSHGGACTLEAMQGAVMLAGGVPLDWDGFGTLQAQAIGNIPDWTARDINDEHRQRIMEAAHRFSEMSSVDICREAVRLDGRMIPSGRRELIRAAFSGSNLTNIWTTNVNARLLMKFRETEDSTRGWTQEADVADFRLNERPRTEKGGSLTKHARGKSADHHSGSDTMESYRIARYSKQYFRDEMDVIDDRLMAGQQIIDEMAFAAARLRPDLVYAILMGNPLMADGTALFAVARSNLDETSAAMDATHLKEAITRMWLMQENGVNLNLTPTHLVTAATLNFAAKQLLNSAETRQIAADGGPTMNEVQGAVGTLLSDSRIDNGVVNPDDGTTIAGDATAFFVISNQGPTIEVGYLRGTGRAPSVTTWKKTGEDGQWGVGASVNMDVGAKAMAFQTMQKLTD